MGILDLFSKESRQKSTLERLIKKAKAKHGQSQDRFAALEKLKQIGTEEAIAGLLQRLSVTVAKSVDDETEKEWVAQTLIAMGGEKVLGPLRTYLKSSPTIAYAFRILDAVATPEQVLEIIDELIESEPPEYTRDPSKKVQLLTILSEWERAPASDVASRVVPYLEDFDESVRFAAVEALSFKKDEDTARLPLLEALTNPDEESRRLKVRIAEVLADCGWKITDKKAEVSPLLDEDLPEFGMHHDRLVRKKGK